MTPSMMVHTCRLVFFIWCGRCDPSTIEPIITFFVNVSYHLLLSYCNVKWRSFVGLLTPMPRRRECLTCVRPRSLATQQSMYDHLLCMSCTCFISVEGSQQANILQPPGFPENWIYPAGAQNPRTSDPHNLKYTVGKVKPSRNKRNAGGD
jgi:hypothetical protein